MNNIARHAPAAERVHDLGLQNGDDYRLVLLVELYGPA